jgi:DNA polymerase
MKGLPAAVCEYLSQRRELGERDFFLSPAFSRAQFLSVLLPRPVAAAAAPQSAQKSAPARFTAPAKKSAPIKKTAKSAPARQDTPRREALKALYFTTQNCIGCALKETRDKVVFGSGSADATIMVIGLAPDTSDDHAGLPLAGAGGKQFAGMLAAAGLNCSLDLFVSYVVKCCPPGSRAPEPDEISACRSCLEQQIAIITPAIILVLGSAAAAALLGQTQSVAEWRSGPAAVYNGIPVVVTETINNITQNPELGKAVGGDLERLQKQRSRTDKN